VTRYHPNPVDDWAQKRAFELVAAHGFDEVEKAIAEALVGEARPESPMGSDADAKRRLESLVYHLAWTAGCAVTLASSAEEISEADFLRRMERDTKRSRRRNA
jgi:hypothetical protein